MLISLVIKVIFQHWLHSLNLYLNINVWICIFMWKKTSLKESKVDSRTHFAVGDLLTREMTFWWPFKSVSREAHCPFKVMTCPSASVTLGPTNWIFLSDKNYMNDISFPKSQLQELWRPWHQWKKYWPNNDSFYRKNSV